MPSFTKNLFRTGYVLRLDVSEVMDPSNPSKPLWDLAANTSQVVRSLYVTKGAGSGRWSGAGYSWASTVVASRSGGGTYDFRDYSTLWLDSGTETVVHNADGTKVLSVSGSFSDFDPVPEVGSGSVGGQFTLTPIPRSSLEGFEDAAWKKKLLERWDGAAWKLQALERWDGGTWVREN